MEAMSVSRNDLPTLRTKLLPEEWTIVDRAIDRASHYHASLSLISIHPAAPAIISIISLLPGFGHTEHPLVDESA